MGSRRSIWILDLHVWLMNRNDYEGAGCLWPGCSIRVQKTIVCLKPELSFHLAMNERVRALPQSLGVPMMVDLA
jgi:hypothetical protein